MKKLLVCLLIILLLCGCASKTEEPEVDGAPLAPPELQGEEPQKPTVEDTNVPRKEPCSLTIANGSQHVAALRGTCSWWYLNKDGTGAGLEADGVHPLDLKDSLDILVMDGTTAELLFGAEEPDKVSVRGWDAAKWDSWEADSQSEQIPVDGLSFELKNGDWIYEVSASWDRFSTWGGTAHYTFRAVPLGVTLHAEAVTDKGMTLVCTQSGGNPSGELQTGSPFWLEIRDENGNWREAETYELEFVWTAEAWLIPMNDTVRWEVDWSWLYGSLPDGTYRLSKEIMDFRGTGDYDTYILYTDPFVIAWVEE